MNCQPMREILRYHKVGFDAPKAMATRNKSAKLTQNTPVVFVVNSMVMTTVLGAGCSAWRADTANSDFGQFKGQERQGGFFGMY